MNIAVNTRLLLQDKLEGIGWFTYEVLKRISMNHPEHRFLFIFDRNYHHDFIFSKNITPVIAKPQARHPVLFYYWFEKSIPSILKKNKTDVFFSPDGFLSLSTSVKSLPVIHDLNFIHRPEDLPYLVRNYYKYFFPKFACKASRIITVSQYSKNDICKTFSIDNNKIDVVYNGINNLFAPVKPFEKENTKLKYTNGNDYFLYVGSIHKRKNIKNLLLAFNKFRKQGISNHKLVIVGEKLFKDKDINRTFVSLKYKNDIIFTGRLSSLELAKVMGSAFALVYIPFFEGFGLPLVEAMASGIPVITSEVTSLPEVAHDAALYADPVSVDSVVEKMQMLVKDHKMYNSLINKGYKRIENYSWDKTADLVWESIEKTYSE